MTTSVIFILKINDLEIGNNKHSITLLTANRLKQMYSYAPGEKYNFVTGMHVTEKLWAGPKQA